MLHELFYQFLTLHLSALNSSVFYFLVFDLLLFFCRPPFWLVCCLVLPWNGRKLIWNVDGLGCFVFGCYWLRFVFSVWNFLDFLAMHFHFAKPTFLCTVILDIFSVGVAPKEPILLARVCHALAICFHVPEILWSMLLTTIAVYWHSTTPADSYTSHYSSSYCFIIAIKSIISGLKLWFLTDLFGCFEFPHLD